MIEERSWFDWIVYALMVIVLGAMALLCIAPFVHIIARSFSRAGAVETNLVSFWPIGFHTGNYEYIIGDYAFVRAFGISLVRAVVGVSLTVFLCIVTAYPLSLDYVRLPGLGIYRALGVFYLVFFPPLIPLFISFKNLGLINSFWVLVLPSALSMFLTILVLNYFRGLPKELAEAARLDGADHFNILFRINVPLATPSIATVALFSAFYHWNSWFDGVVFLSDRSKWPLQSFLYAMVTAQELAQRMVGEVSYAGGSGEMSAAMRRLAEVNPKALGAAMIVVGALPIMIVYPFLQRYFVSGLTLGAIKQ